MFWGRKKARKKFPPKLNLKTLDNCVFARFQIPVIVSQRKDLHIFCYHHLSFCSLYTELKVKLFFIHHFLPSLSSFVDSYYSPCGQLGITPGRFYYCNATFWAEFGYGKYLIVPFLVRFGNISRSFGLAVGILARLRLAKIRTMARQNSPDMPPKRSKKKRLDLDTSRQVNTLRKTTTLLSL